MQSTIIYCSSNRENQDFERKIIYYLLKNCGDLPIISVTQKPIDLGKNICVGEVGVTGFNFFRQMQIACEEAKSDFVISAEADCLYPPDYFQFIPERKDVFYRNQNIYVMGYKRNFCYVKPQGSTFAQIVGREHCLKILKGLFKDFPQWSTEIQDNNFPKGRHKQQDIPDRQEFYSSLNPCISFKTGNGMRYASSSVRIPVYRLPYWGSTRRLKRKFIW